ncbi:velvet factor [Lichtheimia corymbifera JMRC:FSU:9682]|uniref:Velvet factor n=1 Tax=Lichtheimia corymbifera JMRC:FSU:9682 TaxID=1263082 RepID=A0A068RYU3_9FUNG|nr:velvet factor [Lichtheimia corymbifera JMRC:FSU:9682]
MTNIKREIGSHNSIDSHDSPYTSSSSSNAPPPPPPYYGNAHHSVPESLPPPTATTANSNTSSYVHDTRSTGHQVYTEGSSLNPEQEDSALPGTNSDTYATATMAAPPQPTAGGLSGVESFPSQQQQQQQSSLCGAIGYDERERRTYELVVCQQPLHARMCGFGEKDRRPIDPPPIVKLIVQQEQGPVDVQTLQTPFFVLHVTLWSADRVEERNIISNPPKCTRVLMGSLVSSPSLLKDPSGEQGLYFAFPDLSIRTEGRYTLRFSLMKLASSDFQTDAKSRIIAQVFSDPFTVYSAKKFPGMTESTELSKAFAKQGLKIPIRNDVRARKSDGGAYHNDK